MIKITITITNQKSPLSKRHYTLYPMSLQQDIEKMRRKIDAGAQRSSVRNRCLAVMKTHISD